MEIKDIENVVIVGSGPAGYTAALYTSRADLEPLVIEGFAWGGLLQQTTDVENYPGYREGVMGPEMMQEFRDQAERFGTRFITDDATELELASEPGGIHTVHVGDQADQGARGDPRDGGRAEEARRAGRGRAVRARRVLLRHLRRRLLPRRRDDRGRRRRHRDGGRHLPREVRGQGVDRAPARRVPRVGDHARPRPRRWTTSSCVTPYVVERFEPGENGALGKAVLENVEDGSAKELPVTGAFVAIGHRPNSQLVEGQLDLDDEGYVLVDGRSTRTKLPGVFAAGDLTDRVYRQAVTAAGTGCMAALDAEAYLRDTPIDAEAHWAGEPEKVEAAAESAAS